MQSYFKRWIQNIIILFCVFKCSFYIFNKHFSLVKQTIFVIEVNLMFQSLSFPSQGGVLYTLHFSAEIEPFPPHGLELLFKLLCICILYIITVCVIPALWYTRMLRHIVHFTNTPLIRMIRVSWKVLRTLVKWLALLGCIEWRIFLIGIYQTNEYPLFASSDWLLKVWISNNYSPKWRWIAVDIYRETKRRAPLFTYTEVNHCVSIYSTKPVNSQR